jgi:hypothetical protein
MIQEEMHIIHVLYNVNFSNKCVGFLGYVPAAQFQELYLTNGEDIRTWRERDGIYEGTVGLDFLGEFEKKK